MVKTYTVTIEEYKTELKNIIPDITIDILNELDGYYFIGYKFPEGRKFTVTGTKLNKMDIQEEARNILSIRNKNDN